MPERFPAEKRDLRRRGSPQTPTSDPHVEIYLQESGRSTSINREEAEYALGRMPRLAAESDGEWVDPEGRIRIILGEDRILVRLHLLDEEPEDFARCLDELFDFGFELARALGLDLIDPILGAIQTRFRYETQFPKIRDAFYTRARVELSFRDPRAWVDLTCDPPVAAPAQIPSIVADRDSLPGTLWARRARRVGPLEFRGDAAMGILQQISRAMPWIAFVPRGSVAGSPVAVVRVLRRCDPLPGVAIIEGLTTGMTATTAIEADWIRVK